MKIFSNVQNLTEATLQAGTITETKGYYTAGDGGQARYLIKTAAEYGGTPDEYGNHTLANGNVAVLQIQEYINIKQFGAKEQTQDSFFPALAAAVALESKKTIFIDGEFYGGGVSDAAITLSQNTPIKATRTSIISGIGQSGAFVLSPGNYDGTKFEFPTLSGFTGDVIKLYNANYAEIDVAGITNESTCTGINLFTDPEGTTLDNKITLHTANDISNVIVVTGDALSVIQGNEVYVNFALSCLRGVLFFSPSVTDAPYWDGNKFVFQAIDAIGVDGARGITNVAAYAVPRAIFRVESWLGGFDGTAVAWADGKFDESDFYVKIANDMVNYDFWRVVGQGNRVDTGTSGFLSTSKTYSAVSSAGIAGFNSGNPVQDTRFHVNFTTTADLINNQSLILYVYSPYADSISENFMLQPSSIPGLIVDQIAKTGNANEIQIILRNVTGVTISSGASVNFYFTVGG